MKGLLLVLALALVAAPSLAMSGAGVDRTGVYPCSLAGIHIAFEGTELFDGVWAWSIVAVDHTLNLGCVDWAYNTYAGNWTPQTGGCMVDFWGTAMLCLTPTPDRSMYNWKLCSDLCMSDTVALVFAPTPVPAL
jgi:hypothetical protein